MKRDDHSRQYSYVACSTYPHGHYLRGVIANNADDFHVTYSSASDKLFCINFFATYPQYSSIMALPHSNILLSVPIPTVLKFDTNIQIMHHFLAEINIDNNDVKLLESIISGEKAGISVVFRARTSHPEQLESAALWKGSLEGLGGALAMEKIFWHKEVPTSQSKVDPKSNHELLHTQWRRWTAIANSLTENNHHPYLDDIIQSLSAATHRHRSLYIPLSRSLINHLRSFLSLNGTSAKDERTVELDGNVYSAAEIHSSYFIRLLSVLAVDHRVSRIALSRPLRTLNKNARSITQSGSVGYEPFSAAGLNGTNTIVGLSDTGIDESSCFFRDAVHGKVHQNNNNAFTND